MKTISLIFLLSAVALSAQQTPAAAPVANASITKGKNSCVECHATMDGDLQKPAMLIQNDVHTSAGLSCANCHGGDPTSDDMSISMSPAKGFIGKPARTAIPKLCAKCHSSPDFMRQFRPQQRVDQFELYQTSIHGKRLAMGDTNVATCIDCHSVHDIRPVKDAAAPVHPLRLPDTCGRCHADAQHMAKYKIPTNQLADYKTSVHWNALEKRGDLSAPNCASCHGNHGAKPPQAESVSAVCGTCHVLFRQNYEKSVHQPFFSASTATQGGCTVCHSNHAIHKPSTAMLVGKDAVCSTCHENGTAGAKTGQELADAINGLDAALTKADTVLEEAEKAGMEVSEARFKLSDARDSRVKATLAMHTFKMDEVRKPVDAGMAIADETYRIGQAALHDRDVRRIGVAVFGLFMALVIFSIRLVIRHLELNKSASS